MTIYCDDFPTLEGDFDRHEGMGAVQQVGVGWKGGDKTPGESGGQWKACEMGFEIIRREIGKLEGQGWMNGGKEREGEEFPRVHACSTVDRPLESTAESTAPEKWPFLSNFRVLWPGVMASAVVHLSFHPNHVVTEGGVAMTRPSYDAASSPHTFRPSTMKMVPT
jgi:hypothetical protein